MQRQRQTGQGSGARKGNTPRQPQPSPPRTHGLEGRVKGRKGRRFPTAVLLADEAFQKPAPSVFRVWEKREKRRKSKGRGVPPGALACTPNPPACRRRRGKEKTPIGGALLRVAASFAAGGAPGRHKSHGSRSPSPAPVRAYTLAHSRARAGAHPPCTRIARRAGEQAAGLLVWRTVHE